MSQLPIRKYPSAKGSSTSGIHHAMPSHLGELRREDTKRPVLPNSDGNGEFIAEQ